MAERPDRYHRGLPLVPCLSTKVYRVLHLEHHRWAGDLERDPDTPLVHIRMPWYSSPTRPTSFGLGGGQRNLAPTHGQRTTCILSLVGAHFVVVTAFLLSNYRLDFVFLFNSSASCIMMVAYSFAHIQHPEGVIGRMRPSSQQE